MENASKALLMAGGVLIGVLIISLAVYLFADFGSTSAEVNAQNAQKQITAFNSKFTAYEGYKDEQTGEWAITIYDIVSLATYAKENNAYYGGSSNEQISVNIIPRHSSIGGQIQGLTKEEYNSLIKAHIDDDGTLHTFRCEEGSIGYNDNGRVNRITFREN